MRIGIRLEHQRRRVGSTGPSRLIAAGAVSGATFARTSSATYQDGGAAWQQVASGVARYPGTAGRLLVEGQRTNLLRNPRGEGTGTPPTNWLVAPAAISGITTVSALWSDANLAGLELRFDGTAGSTGTHVVYFEAQGFIAGSNGQAFAQSAIMGVTRGTPSAITPVNALRMYDSGGALVGGAGVSGAAKSLTAGMLDYSNVLTVNQATAATVQPSLRVTLTSGVTYAHTLRIAWPRLEQASLRSTPILPPAGSPAQATRQADQVSAPAGQSGTVALGFMLPQAAPSTRTLGLWQVDDGTDANRIVLECAAGGSTIQVRVVSGGATTATLNLGAMTAGTAGSVALSWGSGEVRALRQGGTEQTASVAIPAGLTTQRLGHGAADWSRPAFGEIGPLDSYASPQTLATALAALA